MLTEASTKTHPDEPTRVEERERAQFPRLHAIITLYSAQISSFYQGMVISSQSQVDETDFSQIGENTDDLGFGVFSII